MKNPLISIIIPIFKVEPYIRRCLDSVLSQTYQKLEIILVDDGSPDNCPAICDEYALQDNRINVIHKENGGLSDARNKGLENSTGEWILYVDSDDFIETNSVEKLLQYTNDDIDIVVGVAKEKKLNGQEQFQKHSNMQDGEVLSSTDFICKSIDNGEWFAPAWLNLYRASFLKTNKLFFKKNLLYEDLEILPRVFLCARNICYCNFAFYNYIERQGSIMTNTKLQKSQEDSLYIIQRWKAEFDNILDLRLQKKLYHWLVKCYIVITAKYEIYDNTNAEYLTKFFLLKNSGNFVSYIKVLFFILSKKLYIKVYKIKYKD